VARGCPKANAKVTNGKYKDAAVWPHIDFVATRLDGPQLLTRVYCSLRASLEMSIKMRHI